MFDNFGTNPNSWNQHGAGWQSHRVTLPPVEQCAKPWGLQFPPICLISCSIGIHLNKPCHIKIKQGESTGFKKWTLLISWGLVVFQRCTMPHVGQMYVPPYVPWGRLQGLYWCWWWCGKPTVSLNGVCNNTIDNSWLSVFENYVQNWKRMQHRDALMKSVNTTSSLSIPINEVYVIQLLFEGRWGHRWTRKWPVRFQACAKHQIYKRILVDWLPQKEWCLIYIYL